jgi:hypothetical protein
VSKQTHAKLIKTNPFLPDKCDQYMSLCRCLPNVQDLDCGQSHAFVRLESCKRVPGLTVFVSNDNIDSIERERDYFNLT